MSSSLEERAAAIDALLPQTQCTRCGYPSCRDYARAIADEGAEINQCPPGGSSTIAALAGLLGREARPLNPANGVEAPPVVAVIDEERCIGCAKCVPACPVDAIVGARRLMHTVIEDRCTGCELCLPPCPVDCISLVPLRDASGKPRPLRTRLQLAAAAPDHRRRYDAHLAREARAIEERRLLLDTKKRAAGHWRAGRGPAGS